MEMKWGSFLAAKDGEGFLVRSRGDGRERERSPVEAKYGFL